MPKEGVEIIDYISNPLSEDQLTSLIIKLGITPIELVRKCEAIWKELYKGKVLSDAEITAAMAAHPKLIERPIVETTENAIICRPPELVLTFL